MSRTARTVGSAVAAAALVACGGGATPAPEAAPASSAPASAPAVAVHVPGATGRPAGSGAPGAVPGTSGGTGATAAPGTTPAAHGPAPAPGGASRAAPSPTHVALAAVLAKTCVRPGETQTVSFTARPNMTVLVNTGYADRQDGTVHGGRFNENQRTDAAGRYSATWTVAATAPQGEASTQVVAVDSYGTGNAKVAFRVAAVC